MTRNNGKLDQMAALLILLVIIGLAILAWLGVWELRYQRFRKGFEETPARAVSSKRHVDTFFRSG